MYMYIILLVIYHFLGGGLVDKYVIYVFICICIYLLLLYIYFFSPSLGGCLLRNICYVFVLVLWTTMLYMYSYVYIYIYFSLPLLNVFFLETFAMCFFGLVDKYVIYAFIFKCILYIYIFSYV